MLASHTCHHTMLSLCCGTRLPSLQAPLPPMIGTMFLVWEVGRVRLNSTRHHQLCHQHPPPLTQMDEAWLQATLPVRFGSLGVRSAAHVAPSVYLSSTAASADLVSALLPESNHSDFSLLLKRLWLGGLKVIVRPRPLEQVLRYRRTGMGYSDTEFGFHPTTRC